MLTRRWAMGGGGGFAIQDREVLGHSSRLDLMGTICQDLQYISEIPLFLFTRWPTLRHLLFLDLLMFAHVAAASISLIYTPLLVRFPLLQFASLLT